MTTIYRKGLSELHSGTGPGGEPPKVSIVFIHGLGGHPQRTWSAASTPVGSDSSDRRTSDTSDAAGPSRKASILSWAKHFKSYKTSLPERSLSTTHSTYSVDRPAVAVSPPELDVDPLTAEPETISPPAASPRGIASNPLSRSTSNITINRATSSGKSSKIYWPRDLLPEDFPDARIFTYGYDTDVVKRPFGKDSDSLTNPSEADTEADDPTDPKIKLNFTELAHQFLVALNRGLPDDVPVIICAHSLGGVLTKRALWESRTHIKDRTKHKLAKLTKAVFFFGTPHKGSSVAAWGKIGANIAQSLRFDATTKHVTRLKLDSEVLDIYHGDFMKLLDEGRFWVHSFQESQALTPVLGKVVEDYSSRIDGTPLQQFEKLPGNHRTMIQFSSSRSEGYRRVKECFKDYIGRFDAKNDAERRSIASAHSAMSLNSNTYYCMPYKRNDRFTGREDVIDAVSAYFDPPQSATFVALYGLGGIGKTQVAIEIAERWRYRYPSYSIFWVHATNENAFNQGLQNVAKTLGIPESADTDIRNLIQKWLENRDNGRWLLIIDNVDDRELLNANKGKKIFKLLPCIPKTPHGKVLFTTRHKPIAMDLTTQHVRLDPMSQLESLDLMRATFGGDWKISMETDAIELLEELSYIPLAIVHATCFMVANSTPIARYLRMYRESEESREELLEEDEINGLDNTDIDNDAPKTVLNTTWISLDRVADNLSGSVAIELLAVMTFLHRQNIPMYLLQAYKPDLSSLKLNKAFGVIMGHSLVTEDQASETITMHRLVQLSVRRWLTRGNRKGLTEKYREDAFKLMSEQFPEGSFKDWSKCDQLIIHAETVLNDNSNAKDPASRARLLQNAANYQNGKGQYQAAETKLSEVVTILSETHGVESEKTLQAQDQLAWTLRCQAKKDAALELAQKTLETKKKVLGEGHVNVLTTAHIMATVIGEQGKHQEAAALHQANLDARKTLLGEKHLDTLRSAANLSLELWELGKFSEAEDLARETLAVRQQILGAEHPDSLEVAGTLGFILEIQGKYEEAKQIKEQMLEHREKLYGDDHPDTADSCHDMGWIYHQMGNYDAASPMYERALDAKTRLLGDTHWKTLTTECNFPVFFCDMGHYDEGEARYKSLIEKFKRIQGPEHPQTLDATGGLAVIHRHQAVICAYRNNSEGYNAKLAEAAECARRSIDGRNKVLGPDHPWTLPPVSHWGYILTLQGEYKKGEEVIRDALAKLEEKMGAEASNVCTSLMFLSKNLYFQATTQSSKPFHANPAYDPNDARLVEAEALARRTLVVRKKLLGEEHPYYFKTQHHLAKVLFAKGEKEVAIKLGKEALFGLRKVLGEGLDVEHPDSARAWVEIVGMEMGWVVGIGEVDVSGDKVAE